MDSTRRDFIKVSAMGLAASSASGPSAFAARTFAAPISVWVASGNSRFSLANSISWTSGKASGAVIDLHPESKFQEVLGFGAAFTDASCYVLNQLESSSRGTLFHELFHPSRWGSTRGGLVSELATIPPRHIASTTMAGIPILNISPSTTTRTTSCQCCGRPGR